MTTFTDQLIEVATLAVDMRQKQKAYFKTRDRGDLIASKQAEGAFDKAAAAILAKIEPIKANVEVIAYQGNVTDEQMLNLLATGKMPDGGA